MSNYRDPCEDLDQLEDPLGQGERRGRAESDLDGAGTVYPWTLTSQAGTGGEASNIRIILPSQGAAESLSSRTEFGPESPDVYRERLVKASLRESYMYLQQSTYNFDINNKLAAKESSRYTDLEQLRSQRPDGLAQFLRIPPPRDASYYNSNETVKTVAGLQDPLLYAMGKVFDHLSQVDPLSNDRLDVYGAIDDLNLGFGHRPDGLKTINTTTSWLLDNQGKIATFAANDPELLSRNIDVVAGQRHNVNGFIPNYKVGYQPGELPSSFLSHGPDTLGGNTTKSRVLKLKIVPIKFYDSQETESMNVTAGDDFLMTIFKDIEDCKFLNSNFKCPAAFDLSEADAFPAGPMPDVNFIEIKSFLTKNDNYVPILVFEQDNILEDDGVFKVQDSKRDRTNSVYRDLLSEMVEYSHEPTFTMIEEPIQAVEIGTRCPQKTLSEFYPSSRVADIKKLENRLFAERVDPNTPGQRSWIELYTDSYVQISFNLTEASCKSPAQIEYGDETKNVKQIMEQAGLDTLFLSFFKAQIHANDALFFSSPDDLDQYDLYTHFLDSSIDLAIPGYIAIPMGQPGSALLNPLNERITSGYIPNKVRRIFLKMEHWLKKYSSEVTKQRAGELDELVATRENPSKRFYDIYLNLDEFPLSHDLDHLYTTPNHNEDLSEQEMDTLLEKIETLQTFLEQSFRYFNEALHPLSDDARERTPPESKVFGQSFTRSTSPMQLPIDQALNYSEILAFRIEKKDALTNQVIKEFYLWNKTDEFQNLNFYDTQVEIGKSYVYNIYAINFTIDREYSYSNISKPGPDAARINRLDAFDAGQELTEDQTILPELRFTSTISPLYSIVETPFFSKRITPLNLPPLFPEVSVYRDSIEDDGAVNFRFEMSSRFGTLKEEPVQVLPEDEEIITFMREAQEEISSPRDEEGVITYGSDTFPTEYEMIYLDHAPQSIQDFSRGTSHKVTSDLSSFIFTPTANSERFIIFRTIDGGGISNPSPIYRFQFNSYADGNYYEFEIYEIERQYIQNRMTCRKMISVEPAATQLIYNLVENSEPDRYTNEVFANNIMDSAPVLTPAILRNALDNSIWSRNFKLRLTSINTSRAVDVNFSFMLETQDEVTLEEQMFGFANQEYLTRECRDDKRLQVPDLNRAKEQFNSKLLQKIKNKNLDCDD